ncbi:MAG TPA: hypothetical protein VJ654_14250 [Noviherbaspirillum sp.]|nr:hypothetical protein [Noviherbaspirillum sp.]
MKVFQIQIQTYKGDFVDYHGHRVFTGPIHDRKVARKNLADLQWMTRGHHFNYRIDERDAQRADTRLRAA